MNKTGISWCDYTWNPITGCKRGCVYCYARKIHNRFNKTPFSDIVFHPERLNDPAKIKKPSTVFVGSMSDPEYWNWEQTILVHDICKYYTIHKYMFLSKSPYQYKSWKHIDNIMLGLTLEKCDNGIQYEKLMFHYKENYRNKRFLSLEPLLGRFNYPMHLFDLVIVGAMTGQKAVKPQKEWIQSIIDNVPAEKIHWKPNILPYIKEYGIDLQNSKG